MLSALPAAPAAIPLILAVGFWLLLWVAGLPFVLRKRLMAIRRNEVYDAPETHQLQAA